MSRDIFNSTNSIQTKHQFKENRKNKGECRPQLVLEVTMMELLLLRPLCIKCGILVGNCISTFSLIVVLESNVAS